ncbi:MAG: secretion system protein E [Cycloclasticus sp.]|nr:secretion system protein E [Cycloclasticus sp.]MBG96772.1 secretion system protein E [Cycloclasticus sp.]HAI96281.1 secretion system protein E [Methylococcaceae bacterium]
MTDKKPPKRLGDRLIDKGIISLDQLKIALQEQKITGHQLGKVLIELGFLTETLLKEVLSDSGSDETINLAEVVADEDAIALIDKKVAEQLKVLPCNYNVENKTLQLAMADTFDIVAVDKIKSLIPSDIIVTPILAGAKEIESNIDLFYGYELSIEGILKEIETGEYDDISQRLHASEYTHPLVRLVDAFLTDAVKRGASDIHFEPEEGFLRIRYRIDGVLHQVRSLHNKYWSSIVVRLKVMSHMDLAETRAPQDGRIHLKVAGHPIDFRVAAQPTIHGENFVLRILDREKSIVPLEKLDLSENNRALLKLMMARPEGIILVTGPTGSGKTTTLYSMLSYLNSESVNIMTLEDPVEYPIPMIRQSSIGSSSKMDFANGIRSLMRQDPDIILVGEMRDMETAEMGFRAAMTGHQVFSTLHTNSAIGAFPRLLDIGVLPDIMSGNIIGVIGQRLIRKLCLECKKERPIADVEKKLLGKSAEALSSLYEAVGCKHCHHTGYKGRIAILEILRMDTDLDEMVVKKASQRELLQAAVEKGYLTLADDGIAQVVEGKTTLDELSRVVDFTSRLAE